MFRRFFQRDGGREKSGSQEAGGSETPEQVETHKRAKELLQEGKGQQDDGVHRMAVRTGNQPLPEDPDEQAYGGDEGEHAEIAEKALRERDFKRAIYHLGLALADDPVREEWLALLDQWIAAVGPGALELVPLDDEEYFATLHACRQLMKMGNTPTHRMEAVPVVGKNYHARVAVHAYILAAQGRMNDAVALLLQLIEAKPEIPYVLWFARWKQWPGFAQIALDPGNAIATGVQIMQRYPGTYVFSEQGRAEIQAYLPLIEKSYTLFGREQGNEQFVWAAFTYGMALRKIGSFAAAAEIARKLPQNVYQAQVALAMAETALGNTDASMAAYQRALKVQPQDVAVRNDLGSLLLNQGRLAEALTFYEESTRLDPSDPYRLAFAYRAYLRYLLTPSETLLGELRELAQRQSSARRLLYFIQYPYIGRLPYGGESILNVMRDIKARSAAGQQPFKPGSALKMRTSLLEAPSARLATDRMLRVQGATCDFNVEDVLSPDPRLPLHPVEYQVWRYEGMDPIPAVSPPDAVIAREVAALAQTPYALERWHAPARALGERLGTDALMSLLGIMVHPPQTPAGWDEWDWLHAIQIASALTIAYTEREWEGSRRKAALTSLIYGPLDWSGAAALIAMAVLARQDERIHIELDSICRDLWHFGRGSAEWPLEEAMVYGLLFTEECSDESKRYIDEYFEERRQREEDNKE